ncbi:MAG: spondin domain-containing protein [Phycisphaerales bacterium]
MRFIVAGLLSAGAVSLLAGEALGAPVEVRVTVRNLAPTNSVAFAPLRIGFNSGMFDSFDNGQPASAAIISIAEGGSGIDWFPAFASAEPNAVLGSVVPNPAGPLLPGATASGVFTVDPAVNRYFTFGSMVVPSNDHFIGNDNPTRYQLFDANGNLAISTISQFGRDIWDAGSEVTEPLNAAFLEVGMNALRIPENGVVNFNFSQLDAYNGLTTSAGYVFSRQFAADDEVYRVSFELVPAPGASALFGLAALALRRRRRAGAH